MIQFIDLIYDQDLLKHFNFSSSKNLNIDTLKKLTQFDWYDKRFSAQWKWKYAVNFSLVLNKWGYCFNFNMLSAEKLLRLDE